MEEQEDVPGITMPLVDLEVVVEHMVMVEEQVGVGATQVEHPEKMCPVFVLVEVVL